MDRSFILSSIVVVAKEGGGLIILFHDEVSQVRLQEQPSVSSLQEQKCLPSPPSPLPSRSPRGFFLSFLAHLLFPFLPTVRTCPSLLEDG